MPVVRASLQRAVTMWGVVQEAMRKRIGVHKELELKHEGKVVKQMLEVTATLPQHLRDRLALNTAIIVRACAQCRAVVAWTSTIGVPCRNSSKSTASTPCDAL